MYQTYGSYVLASLLHFFVALAIPIAGWAATPSTTDSLICSQALKSLLTNSSPSGSKGVIGTHEIWEAATSAYFQKYGHFEVIREKAQTQLGFEVLARVMGDSLITPLTENEARYFSKLTGTHFREKQQVSKETVLDLLVGAHFYLAVKFFHSNKVDEFLGHDFTSNEALDFVNSAMLGLVEAIYEYSTKRNNSSYFSKTANKYFLEASENFLLSANYEKHLLDVSNSREQSSKIEDLFGDINREQLKQIFSHLRADTLFRRENKILSLRFGLDQEVDFSKSAFFMSYEEIAEIERLKVPTVKAIEANALNKLEARLKEIDRSHYHNIKNYKQKSEPISEPKKRAQALKNRNQVTSPNKAHGDSLALAPSTNASYPLPGLVLGRFLTAVKSSWVNKLNPKKLSDWIYRSITKHRNSSLSQRTPKYQEGENQHPTTKQQDERWKRPTAKDVWEKNVQAAKEALKRYESK